MRPALLNLNARVREMDATGQDMAVLSLNPPGVQPYQPAAAVRLAREFNDALAAIVRQRPGRLGGLGTVAPPPRAVRPLRAARRPGRYTATVSPGAAMIRRFATPAAVNAAWRVAPSWVK